MISGSYIVLWRCSEHHHDTSRAAHVQKWLSYTPAFPTGWLRAQLDSLPFDLCLEGIGLVGWEGLRWGDYFTVFF